MTSSTTKTKIFENPTHPNTNTNTNTNRVDIETTWPAYRVRAEFLDTGDTNELCVR
jgi:hypothetical protein